MPGNKSRLAVMLLTLMLYPVCAATAAPKQEKPHPRETHKAEQNEDRGTNATGVVADIADAFFTELERRTLCDYFKVISCGSANLISGGKDKIKGRVGSKDKSALLPPGLAKQDDLPPGLEKQYQRNGKLPPGLQKRLLPDDLSRNLPRRDDRYERVIVGRDVVLIETATGIIRDILEGIVTGD